jgi:hypothetical protein
MAELYEGSHEGSRFVPLPNDELVAPLVFGCTWQPFDTCHCSSFSSPPIQKIALYQCAHA